MIDRERLSIHFIGKNRLWIVRASGESCRRSVPVPARAALMSIY
jgi:hypothetical protein